MRWVLFFRSAHKQHGMPGLQVALGLVSAIKLAAFSFTEVAPQANLPPGNAPSQAACCSSP